MMIAIGSLALNVNKAENYLGDALDKGTDYYTTQFNRNLTTMEKAITKILIGTI